MYRILCWGCKKAIGKLSTEDSVFRRSIPWKNGAKHLGRDRRILTKHSKLELIASQSLCLSVCCSCCFSVRMCKLEYEGGSQKTAGDSTPASLSRSEPTPFTLPCPVTSSRLSFQGTLPFEKGTFRAVLWTWAPIWTHHYHVLGVLNFIEPHFLAPLPPICGVHWNRDLGLPEDSDMCLSEQPPVRVSTGRYFWLEPTKIHLIISRTDMASCFCFTSGSLCLWRLELSKLRDWGACRSYKWVTTALPLLQYPRHLPLERGSQVLVPTSR